MDFAFTPEQIELRRAVRDFAEAEIGPHVRKWDDSETFPLETIKKLGVLGYMGAILPEDLGGAGLGYIEYCIIIEELSRVDGSVGIILAAHTSLCANHIYKSGTDSQRKLYIPRLASGEWLGCWGLTEPSAGSDASGTQTRAVFDGQWILDGSKSFTRTRTMPMFAWPWRSPMPQPETGVFLHSSWKEKQRDSESVKRKRNLDCGPAQQEKWSLKTVVWTMPSYWEPQAPVLSTA
jgi:hypothetical protein